jgi:hypothetical protein
MQLDAALGFSHGYAAAPPPKNAEKFAATTPG